jgi:hypothetical protein
MAQPLRFTGPKTRKIDALVLLGCKYDPLEMSILSRVPRRTVIRGDALSWLAGNPAAPNTSVVTSLPDVSELAEYDFEQWRRWFLAAAQAVLAWVPDDGVALFFQSDVLARGVWIDKSFLVLSAAQASGHQLVWHKIVCRTAPGSLSPGRPGYSHLLCFAREARPAFRHLLPDVLPDAGFEPSPKAMGVEACALAVRFALAETSVRTIVDPFCGQGTALAVANAFGLDAVGVDRSERCCRAARKLTVAVDAR